MKYLFFLGTGHSGSTILSAILHSHDNVHLSEEWGAVSKLLLKRCTVEEMHRVILQCGKGTRRRSILDRLGNLEERPKDIQWLGDKGPWDMVNTWHRSSRANIFEQLEDKLDAPIKVILPIRNPYEHLPGYFRSPKYLRQYRGDTSRLHRKFLRYLARTQEAAAYAIEHADCLVVANEDLIQKHSETIYCVLNFLDLPIEKHWVRHVGNAIYNRSDKVEYDFSMDHRGKTLEDHVEERIIARFEPLKRYSRK